jgi:hypothetical protein
MVIGVDVCTNKGNSRSSVVAIVSSLNGREPDKLNSTQFFSRCQQQQRNYSIFTGYEPFILGLK